MEQKVTLQKSCDVFRTHHQSFLAPEPRYSVGYGVDPARKGPTGIVVHVTSADVQEQDKLLQAAREKLPAQWDGFPVYYKVIPYSF